MWSLATEVAFYLVLPGIMWLALSRRRRRTHRPGAGSGSVVAVLVLLNVVWVLDLASRLDTRRLDDRRCGCRRTSPGSRWGSCSRRAPSHVHRDGRTTPVVGSTRVASPLRQMGLSPGVCWTAALALFAISATPLAGPSRSPRPRSGEAMTKNLLYAATAGLLILPGVFADPAGRFIRVMSHAAPAPPRPPLLRRLLRAPGDPGAGRAVARHRAVRGSDLELFALTLVISLLVSEVLYRLVERPAMRLRNLGRSPRVEVDRQQAPPARPPPGAEARERPGPPVGGPQRPQPVEDRGARRPAARSPRRRQSGIDPPTTTAATTTPAAPQASAHQPAITPSASSPAPTISSGLDPPRPDGGSVLGRRRRRNSAAAARSTSRTPPTASAIR